MAFIKQEALEKAREIKVKADEEFAIEKAKLVKQEQQAIDAQYEKKRKGAEVAQKMCVPPLASYLLPQSGDAHRIPLCSAQSTLTNKSRLKLLHRREEHLQDLFNTARQEITNVSSGSTGQYEQYLEGMILQGALYKTWSGQFLIPTQASSFLWSRP